MVAVYAERYAVVERYYMYDRRSATLEERKARNNTRKKKGRVLKKKLVREGFALAIRIKERREVADITDVRKPCC